MSELLWEAVVAGFAVAFAHRFLFVLLRPLFVRDSSVNRWVPFK